MKKKNVRLPDKLSDLLALALRDMRAVKKLKSRVLDMDNFHCVRSDGKCAVCMAGAVMDRTLGAGPRETCSPGDFDFMTANKLRVIDSMRSGELRDSQLVGEPDEFRYYVLCDSNNGTVEEFNALVKKHWRRRLQRAPLSVYDEGVEILRAAGF